MLETIAEFAFERLEEGGELEDLRRRHAEYYLELARSVEDLIRSPQAAALLDQIERDHDNLRAALKWLPGAPPDRALRIGMWGLAGRLQSFGDVALASDNVFEAARLFRESLEAGRLVEDDLQTAYALAGLAAAEQRAAGDTWPPFSGVASDASRDTSGPVSTTLRERATRRRWTSSSWHGIRRQTSLEEGRRCSARPSPTCSRASTERRGKKPSARLPLPTDAERPPLGSPFTSAIRARPGSRERGPSASGRADGRRPRVPPRAPPVPAHNRLGPDSRHSRSVSLPSCCHRRAIVQTTRDSGGRCAGVAGSLQAFSSCSSLRWLASMRRTRRRTMTLTRRPSGSSRNPASRRTKQAASPRHSTSSRSTKAARSTSCLRATATSRPVPGIGPAAALGPGDEGERETTAEAPDFEALRRVTPVGDDEAARKTAAGLARAGLAPPESVDALHSELTFQVPGDSERSHASDRHDCALPTGPRRRAARRTRLAHAGDVRARRRGHRAALGDAEARRGPSVELLPPGQARHECASRYPPRSKIRKPRLSTGLLWRSASARTSDLSALGVQRHRPAGRCSRLGADPGLRAATRDNRRGRRRRRGHRDRACLERHAAVHAPLGVDDDEPGRKRRHVVHHVPGRPSRSDLDRGALGDRQGREWPRDAGKHQSPTAVPGATVAVGRHTGGGGRR